MEYSCHRLQGWMDLLYKCRSINTISIAPVEFEVNLLFNQQNLLPSLRKPVSGNKPTRPSADDDIIERRSRDSRCATSSRGFCRGRLGCCGATRRSGCGSTGADGKVRRVVGGVCVAGIVAPEID